MQTWGGECVASPSNETQVGRDILAEMPDTPVSLGIAISEVIEAAVSDGTGEARYALGAVLNHVMLPGLLSAWKQKNRWIRPK